MKFKGIELYYKPTYGAVMNVEEVVNDWLLAHIPILELDQKKEFELAIQEYLYAHPAILGEQMKFNKSIGQDRLVMLVTNKTLPEVQHLKNIMAYEDYLDLITKCKNVLGFEEVDDFLERLKTNTSTPPDENKNVIEKQE